MYLMYKMRCVTELSQVEAAEINNTERVVSKTHVPFLALNL